MNNIYLSKLTVTIQCPSSLHMVIDFSGHPMTLDCQPESFDFIIDNAWEWLISFSYYFLFFCNEKSMNSLKINPWWHPMVIVEYQFPPMTNEGTWSFIATINDHRRRSKAIHVWGYIWLSGFLNECELIFIQIFITWQYIR